MFKIFPLPPLQPPDRNKCRFSYLYQPFLLTYARQIYIYREREGERKYMQVTYDRAISQHAEALGFTVKLKILWATFSSLSS